MKQKKRRVRVKKIKQNWIFYIQKFRIFFVSLLISFVVITAFLFYKSYEFNRQQALREKKYEMTKLSKEMKKELRKTASPSASFRIPILLYHYVEIVTDKRDTIRQSLDINPDVFEKQIETLTDAGYTFITPSLIGEVLNGEKELPKKPVILSFDDGYRDFYTDVLPIIKKHNTKVVAYIVPGFLDKINYLFTWQLHEIQSSGLVEIGAHTVHHVYLKGMNPAKAEYEILESKHMLEQMLYIPIVSFAYPYGAFDKKAIELVKKAGFTTGVSTIGGNDVSGVNRFFLYRIHQGSATGQGLLNAIERTYPKPY